jgi:probable rRNA maturation factor
MGQLPIHFFFENISYILKQKAFLRNWIRDTIVTEGFKLNELNFIFCPDDYLLSINRQYLHHDTYTDIITFDTSENKQEVSGDIFISLDRIRENAVKFKVSEKDELHRVMIHGTLHLLGYSDKGKTGKSQMREKENHFLSKRNF